MGALSTISRIEFNGQIRFPIIQYLEGRGAHSADFFNIECYNSSFHFLVIPSYYQCHRDVECYATKLYMWNWISNQFDLQLTIASSGPGQTDHIHINIDQNSHQTILVIAENFLNKLSLYEILIKSNSGRDGQDGTYRIVAKLRQQLTIPGVASCAVSYIDQDIYLTGASYHNKGWHTNSITYKYDKTLQSFVAHQTHATIGPHDVDTFTYQNHHFLVFSQDRNEQTPVILSQVSAIV